MMETMNIFSSSGAQTLQFLHLWGNSALKGLYLAWRCGILNLGSFYYDLLRINRCY